MPPPSTSPRWRAAREGDRAGDAPVDLRLRLLSLLDRALAALVAPLPLGPALAFGGAVWWARPALAVLTALLLLASLLRAPLQGSWRVLRSPLAGLGALAILLGIV